MAIADNLICLDSLRDELDGWGKVSYIDKACIADILKVLDVFESDAVELVREYPRLRAVLGYWIASFEHELDDLQAESDRNFSKALDIMKGSITEKKAKVSDDDAFYTGKLATNACKRYLSILKALLDIMKETDIIVQMSVNRRREDDIDGSYAK